MSNLKMVEVGTNDNGESLYNVRYKSGELVSEDKFTKEKAEAMVKKGAKEAPKEAPEVEETPEVEEAPEVEEEEESEEEEEEEEESEEEEVPDYESMTKVELEALMRDHGVELDRRLNKSDLLEQVDTYFKENFSS